MDIRRIGAIKDRDEVIGNQTRVKIVKNKLAPPFVKLLSLILCMVKEYQKLVRY